MPPTGLLKALPQLDNKLSHICLIPLLNLVIYPVHQPSLVTLTLYTCETDEAIEEVVERKLDKMICQYVDGAVLYISLWPHQSCQFILSTDCSIMISRGAKLKKVRY